MRAEQRAACRAASLLPEAAPAVRVLQAVKQVAAKAVLRAEGAMAPEARLAVEPTVLVALEQMPVMPQVHTAVARVVVAQ